MRKALEQFRLGPSQPDLPKTGASWRLGDFLAACRVAAGIRVPPALVKFRSGQLPLTLADADMTPAGFPLRQPVLDRPRRQRLPARKERTPGQSAPDIAALAAIDRALHGLRPHDGQEDLLSRARLLEAGLSESPASGSSNAGLFAAYAVHVLRQDRSAATARNRLLGVHTLVEWATGGAPIASLGVIELQDGIAEVLQICVRHGTMQARRSALKGYMAFLKDRGHLSAVPKWNDPELRVPRETALEPVLLPGEVERLVTDSLESGNRSLAAAVILGGWCGLRRAELTNLSVDDVEHSGLGDIWVRTSKTPAGRRRLPGRLLIPSSAYSELERYRRWRMSAGSPTNSWLLNRAGEPYSPDDLGREFAALTRRSLGRELGLHVLRRTFASWLLVRFLVAHRGCDRRSDGSAYGEEIMSDSSLAGVREIFDLAASRSPEASALWVVAALLGHTSPEVSVGYYLTSLEWIQFLVMPEDDLSAVLRLASAAAVMGLRGLRRLQALFRHTRRPHGKISLRDLEVLLTAHLSRAFRRDHH